MTAPSETQIKPGILNALRKATSIAINFNPRVIVLIPQLQQKNPNGGAVTWVAQTPRDAQTFTIEPVESTLQGITGTAGGGITSQAGGAQAHEWLYNLTGTWDSEMDVNDQWQDGDIIYRITAIQPYNGYERVAVVTGFGKNPNYGS